MRALVVDDNATNRTILLKMLAAWHAIPAAVESGARAITTLQEAQGLGRLYPIILLDAQMPEMDGFALAECIKRNPIWKTATVMMLSSAGRHGDAKRCRELGVYAYLTKPVRRAELRDAILKALSGRTAEEATPGLVTRHSLRETKSGYRILLAEDNPVNQVLALRLLEKRAYGAGGGKWKGSGGGTGRGIVRSGADGRSNAGNGWLGGHCRHTPAGKNIGKSFVHCGGHRPRDGGR
jgi:CheY-like chemotaxis protein